MCVPNTLIFFFNKKLKSKSISLGAQNCHHFANDGPFTGAVNASMLKKAGAKYVILGHSENRNSGETDYIINKKIHSALKENLKIIFCVGEKISDKKKNNTYRVLRKQINNGLKGIKKIDNIIVAYEPVWSIGTGIIPKNSELSRNIDNIKKILNKLKKTKNIKILYGGSVNPKNIKEFNYENFKFGIFLQNMYYYKINLLSLDEGNGNWPGSRICKKKYLKSFFKFRLLKLKNLENKQFLLD